MRESAKNLRDIAVFELDGRRFALPLGDTVEFLRALTCTPLPKAPPVVEGVINLRGTVVPVFDLRQRFRMPPRTPDPSQYLIVARNGTRIVALRVDGIVDVVQIDAEDIADVSTDVEDAEYVAGVAKFPDGLVLIHDLRTFLSAPEAERLATALAEAKSAGTAP